MDPIPFPFDKYPTVQELCLKVLRRFSSVRLRGSRDCQQLGPSGKPRPPEAVFQDEFYRCYWDELGPGVGISSEWAGTSEGRIDFQIVDPGWGIELLRDGDQLQEHCGRFSQNGSYYSWIQRGLLRDWMVLDCRHTYPRTNCENPPCPNSYNMITNMKNQTLERSGCGELSSRTIILWSISSTVRIVKLFLSSA